MSTLPLSRLHAVAGRFVTCALAHISPLASGRATARYGVHRMPRGTVHHLAKGAAGVVMPFHSPAPPPREDQPEAFGGASKARGEHSFFQWGSMGSANNPWKSGRARAKYLILERMLPTSYPCFSTGYAEFSTGHVLGAACVPFSFFLSKSLKEKEKERGNGEGWRAKAIPQVNGDFPRVFAGAYFLGHGFWTGDYADPWKSLEIIHLTINDLMYFWCVSTDPQVAMPVLPSHAPNMVFSGGRWDEDAM